MIDFHQLIGAGGKEGAREVFEKLVRQLVGLRYPGVARVAANPGDWGIDTFLGELDGVVSVWQSKFFIDGVAEPQKAQIRESFGQVVKKAGEEGFSLDAWSLCIPVEFDGPTRQWWDGWKRRQEKQHGIAIELWDRGELETLLLSVDAAAVRAAYFPGSFGLTPRPPAVLPVPDDVSFDEMLFVKQLQAARITELESSKQQFFNAEALSPEVADKRVSEHVHALEGERADLLSMWEDRFNRACQQCADNENHLPALHGDVMAAIERRHDSRASIDVLPMHLVHRKGAMHQVVDAGRAGWVRDFRRVAAEHDG